MHACASHAQFPSFSLLPAEDYERYRQQHGYIRRICALYEATPADYPQLVDLLQQARGLQACRDEGSGGGGWREGLEAGLEGGAEARVDLLQQARGSVY